MTGRFVTSNKGDNEAPDCRARYVACEVHTYDDTAVLPRLRPWKQSGSYYRCSLANMAGKDRL